MPAQCGCNYFLGEFVGIGTAAPARVLHLVRIGSEAGSGIQFSDDTAGNYQSAIVPHFAGGVPESNKLKFRVSDGTPTGQPQTMVLTGGGRVGIGTAAPQTKLEIAEGSLADSSRGIRMTADSLDFRVFGESATVGAGYIGTVSPHSLRFFTNGTGHVVMTLQPDGSIGIGATNPQATLDVAGTGRFSSDLTVGHDLTVTNNATVVQDLTAQSSIRAGSPSIKVADGGGCYYAA